MIDGDASAWTGAGFWRRGALLDDVEALLRRGEGFSIATLNLDHVVRLRRDPAFLSAYLASSHLTADGNPVVWLERLAGRRAELVPGSDLIEPLLSRAAECGAGVAFLGSTQASLDKAARRLEKRLPGLRIVERIAPPADFDVTSQEADAIIARLERSRARLCLVALGAPKQEILIARARKRLPHMGFAGIGAGLDFLSGRQIRAPHLFRTLKLEWAWRFAQSPRRLGGRYLHCAAALPCLAVSALRVRAGAGRASNRGIA